MQANLKEVQSDMKEMQADLDRMELDILSLRLDNKSIHRKLDVIASAVVDAQEDITILKAQ